MIAQGGWKVNGRCAERTAYKLFGILANNVHLLYYIDEKIDLWRLTKCLN